MRARTEAGPLQGGPAPTAPGPGSATGVRTSPLTAEEITTFYTKGYLRPGRIFSDEQVEFLRDLVGRLTRQEDEAGRRYDLLDPALWPDVEDGNGESLDGAEPVDGRRSLDGGESVDGGGPAGDANRDPAQSFDFLFNMWLIDDDFRAAVFNPTMARWAAQLLGTTSVRLLEDNALNKSPSPHELRWHQDYSYWPLAQANAVTAWVALDHTSAHNGAMRMACGSHHLGERLPVVFGTGTPYLRESRPASVGEVGDPEALGLPVEVVELAPGEVSMHSALTWHASGPNLSDRGRRAMVVRYVADGTIWLGAQRYEYNYTDEEVGLDPGEPIGGRYFPVIGFQYHEEDQCDDGDSRDGALSCD
ncbi:MAG: phytanoyl-CoA dioxygenase family protein [bacterium]|nr:phytanoyl-CoA dioxygenase family protein [bacterium]MCY4103004.1 phytanoyl-CoA dioxygenase family protein [bacterium]